MTSNFVRFNNCSKELLYVVNFFEGSNVVSK
jgi:hypothetical protein